MCVQLYTVQIVMLDQPVNLSFLLYLSRVNPDAMDTRRLREKVEHIYDALDAQNYKQSLKLCTALLSKSDDALVRSLKALSLLRLGRTDESLSLCRAFIASVREMGERASSARGASRAAIGAHLDTAAVSTFAGVLRAAGCAQEATALYESSYVVEAHNEDVGIALFEALMGGGDWGGAQRHALRLYRTFGSRRYVLWAATGLVVQADAMAPAVGGGLAREAAAACVASPPLLPEQTKLLTLAAAMLKREAPQLQGEGHQKLRSALLAMQLETLSRLGDVNGQIEILEGAETAAQLEASPEERLGKLANLHETNGAWAKAYECHKTVLEGGLEGGLEGSGGDGGNPDSWQALEGIVRCALAMSASTPPPPDANALQEEAAALLERLQKANPRLRGPVLARISQCHRLMLGSDSYASGAGTLAPLAPGPSAGVDAFVDALQVYFAQFAQKTCAALDVAPYLWSLRGNPPAQLKLMSPLVSAHGIRPLPLSETPTHPASVTPPFVDVGALYRFCTACAFLVASGSTEDWAPSERMRVAGAWMERWAAAAPLSAHLDERERKHADALPLLAAEVLLARPPGEWMYSAVAVRRQPLVRMVSALVGLRLARKAAPANPQLSLYAIQACLSLNLPSEASALWQICDIKHIQLESLSHLLLPGLLSIGALPQASTLLRAVGRFGRDGLKEIPTAVLTAYNCDNLTQVLDFLSFARSLSSGWWRLGSELFSLLVALPELSPAVVSVESLLCASPLEPLLAAHGPAARDPDRNGPPLVAELTTPPDSLDMDLFETVLPPPPAEVRGVRKLRKVWMPRRFLLLRLLRIACSAASAANTAGANGANGGSARGESGSGSGEDGSGGAFAVEAVKRVAADLDVLAAVAEAEAAAEATAEATAEVTAEATAEAADEEGTWTAVSTLCNCELRFAQALAADADEGEEAAADASEAAADSAMDTLDAALRSLARELADEIAAMPLKGRVGVEGGEGGGGGGYPPSLVPSLAILAQLLLPAVATVRATWAQRVPKRSKGGEAAHQQPNHQASRHDRLRAMLRQLDAQLSTAVGALIEALNPKELRPCVLALLGGAQSSEGLSLSDCLGGVPAVAEEAEALAAAVEADHEQLLTALRGALVKAHAALSRAAK